MAFVHETWLVWFRAVSGDILGNDWHSTRTLVGAEAGVYASAEAAEPGGDPGERLDALRRALAVYRMVFGQARQEDLIDYLLLRFNQKEVSALAKGLRIDLQPPRNGRGSP